MAGQFFVWNMISKKYKLSTSFFSSFRKRRPLGRFDTEFFFLSTFPPEYPHARFAVVVPLKVARLVVSRNKIKRAAFSCIAVGGFVGKQGPDCVVFVKKIPQNESETSSFCALLQSSFAKVF